MDDLDRLLILSQLLQLSPEHLRERAAGLREAGPLPPGLEFAADGLAFHTETSAALAPLRAEFDDDDRWLSLGQLLGEGVEVQDAARQVRAGWRRDTR